MSTRVSILCLVVVALLAPSAARASKLITPKGTSITERSVSMLVIHDGSREHLIQELEVESNAPEGLWLIALPSAPASIMSADPQVLANLDALTEVKEPHNEIIRRSLFGPSVVTLLTKKLIDPPARAKQAKDTEQDPPRRLTIVDSAIFSGHVVTSTITGRATLPAPLVALADHFGGIDADTESFIAAYLNRDWAIIASTVRDPRPNAAQPAKLGPIAFDVSSPSPFVPVGAGTAVKATPFHIYIASASVLAPIALDAFWDARPWATAERQASVFYVSYNRPIGEDDRLEFELRERNNFGLTPAMRLMRSDIVLPPGVRSDLLLTDAKESVTLPPSGGHGSTIDMLFCVLLGLTPLLYSPESWFLLWVGARARERARREGKAAFGIRLWSAYALAVGVYWFFTLEGGARVAAIIPALVGILQFALPYVEREPTRIRVQFRKKKTSQKS